MATISGLKSGATISLELDHKTIKLTESVLGDNDITLTPTSGKVFGSFDASGYGFNIKLVDGEGPEKTSLGLTENENNDTWNYDSTTSTATYDHVKGKGWTLNGNTATFTEKVTTHKITITNVKSESGITIENTTTVKISKDVLPQGDVYLEGTGYTFELGEGTSATNENPDWSYSDGTATYKFNTTEGWTIDDSTIKYSQAKNGANATTILTVSGLATSVNNLSLGDAGKTITISKDNFGTNASDEAKIELSVESGYANAGYKLALAAETATQAKFDTEAAVTVNSEGKVIGTMKDYCTSTDTAITYRAADTEKVLATITGLAITSTENVIVDKDTHTIKLKNGALGASNISITNETGIADYTNYSIALDSTDSTISTQESVVDADELPTVSVTNGTATITGKTKAYYTKDESTGEIKYHESVDITLATIKNLNTSETGSNITVVKDETTGKYSIQLAKDALTTKTVTLTKKSVTDIEKLDLKLTLASDVSNGTAGDKHWTFDAETATYQQITPPSYTASGDGQKISYTKEKTTKFFTIENLFTTLSTTGETGKTTIEDITVNDNDHTVTLNKSVLTENASTPVQLIDGTSSEYTLKLTGEGVNNDGSKIGLDEDTANPVWYVKDGVARYQVNTNAGWEVSDGKTVNYTAAKTDYNGRVLATIEGLKSGVTAGNLLAASADGVITLSAAVLNDTPQAGKTVTLTNKDGSAYKLALAEGISNITDTNATIALTTDATNGTAAVKETKAAGWQFATDAKLSMTYKAEVDTTLATITGLNAEGTTADNVTLGTGENAKKIYIAQDALKANSNVTLTNTDAANGYTLALKGATGNTFGFEPMANAWTVGVDDTTATYSSQTKEGWTLDTTNNDKITYKSSDATKTTLATVSGLKSGFTTDDISADDTTVKLKAGALGESEISVTEGYTLAFDDSLNAIDTYGFANKDNVAGNKWEITDAGSGSKTAVYKHTTGQGWTIGGDGKITHTPENTVTLATITGLNADVTEEQLTALHVTSNGEIELTNDVLDATDDGKSVSITDTEGDAVTYTLKLAEGVATTTTKDSATGLHFPTTADGTATVKTTRTAGWKANGDGSFTYASVVDNTLATISGLGEGASAENVTLAETTIKLKEGALGTTEISVDNNYTLAFDETTNADGTYGFANKDDAAGNAWTLEEVTEGGITSKTAVYKHTTGQGWTLEGGKITYKEPETVTLATITGLKATVTETELNNALTASTYNKGTFTLTENLLADTNITLTTNNEYTLKFKADNDDIKNKLGFGNEDATSKYWTATGGTATYQYDVAKGWTLDTTTKMATFTAADNNKTIATIRGLNVADITGKDTTTIAGINIDTTNSKYILDKRVLATTDSGSAELVNGEGQTAYTLDIDTTDATNGVSTDNTQKNVWAYDSENGTATYNKITPAHYTADSGIKITYTAEKIDSELAKVTGLSKDLVVNADRTAIGTKNENGTFNSEVVKAEDTNGSEMIKLQAGALNKTNLENTTANSKYKLVTEGVPLPDATDQTWTITTSNGVTTATFKANVPEGYSIAADGKSISHSAAEGVTTLMTISGLDSSVKDKVSDDGSAIEGIIIDDNAKTITVAKELRGTSAITVGITGYKLALENGETTPTSTAFWTVSNGTATYKKATPAYYTLNTTDNKIEYVAEAEDNDFANKVVISNLASNIVANADGSKLGYINENNQFVEAVTFDTTDAENKKVKVKKAALGTSNVTLTGNYTFEFDATGGDTFAPTSTSTWSIKNSKAVLKSDTTAGYTLDNDSKTINYSAARNGATVLEISGLKDNVAEGNDGNKGKVGVRIDGTFTPIEFTAPTDSAKGKVTVKAEMLGNGPVKISSDNYEFVVENGTILASDAAAPAATSEWRIVNGEARYTAYTPEYRQFNANKNEITYHAKAVSSDLVTVKGLPSGFKIANSQVVDADGNELLTLTDKVVTINDKALSKGTITVTGTGYTIAENASREPQADKEFWTVSGTTATLRQGTSEGYNLESNGTKLVYKSATTTGATTLATITGLKSGIKVEGGKLGISDGGEFREVATVEGDNIKLSNYAFGASNVTLSNGTGQNYNLVKADPDPGTATAESTMWVVSGTTATLKKATAFATYTPDETNPNKLIYKKATLGSVVATVRGIKKGTAVDAFGNLEGIKVGKIESETFSEDATGKVLRISKDLLDPKNKVSVDNGYSLALDTGVTKPEATTGNVWKVSGTTVTIGAGTTGGYILDSGKIVYQAAAQNANPAITITNLKSGLKLNDAGEIDGIDIDNEHKTITLSKAALGTTTSKVMTLSVTAEGAYKDYKLALGDDVIQAVPSKQWVISGTTATYKTVTPKGYVLDNDSNTIKYFSAINNAAPDITITGLKKGLTLNANGTIDGITIATDDSKKITVDRSVLGNSAVKLTTKNDYKDYTLAKGDDFATNTDKQSMWLVSGTTATYRAASTPETYELNSTATTNANKELKYTAAKYGKVLATVKGLKSGLDVANGAITGITVDETKESGNVTGGTIKLSASVLDKKDVSVASSIGMTLVQPDDVTAPTATPTWVFNNGTATYTTTTSAGYKLDTDSKKLAYSDETTVKATITGLSTSATAENNFSVSGDTITVKKEALGTSKVSINGGDYKFALHNDVNASVTGQIKKYWKIDGTTATYYEELPAGSYYLDGKTITYMSGPSIKTLATITGLKEGLELSADKSTFGTYATPGDGTTAYTAAMDIVDDTIKLKEAALGENTRVTVNITSNAYKLGLDSEVNQDDDKHVAEAWYLNSNKTSATYCDGTAAYYTLKDDKEISYTAFKAGATLATLTGINKKGTLTNEDLNSGIAVGGADNVVSLSKDIIEVSTSDISISGSSKPAGATSKVDYTLAFGSNAEAKDINNKKQVGGDPFAKAKWYASGTTLTLKTGTQEKWVLDTNKKIKYTAENPSTTLATLKNLASGIKPDENGVVLGIDFTNPTKDNNGSVTAKGTITISNEEFLNKKDVALSSTDKANYELVLVGVAAPTYADPEVTVSKSAATIKRDVLEGYEVNSDKSTIKYVASTTGQILAKVSGLNANVTEDDITLGTKQVGTGADTTTVDTIKLGAGALGTSKVSLTNQNNATYRLDLEDDVVKVGSTEAGQAENKWSVSGTTATLKGVKPVSYTVTGNNDTAVSVKGSTSEDIVAVTGLKSKLAAVDGEIVGIEADTESKVVILNAEDVLGTSTVRISKGQDYTLQVEGYETPEIDDETLSWSKPSSGSTTLTAAVSAGFTQKSETEYTYSAKVNKATLATVKGLATGVSLTADEHIDGQTINLAAKDLGVNKVVTVSGGKYNYDFVFDGDYENASIFGSTATDSITVNGVGVSISAGKGDDYVELLGYGVDETDSTKEIGDTFVYASGDGNDVIADFSSYDKIKITSGTVSADSIAFGSGDDADNVIIKIGSGSIKLLDWDKNDNEINFIINNTEKAFKYEGSAFTEITQPANGGRAVLDEELVMTPESLVKQTDAIAYSGNDKK